MASKNTFAQRYFVETQLPLCRSFKEQKKLLKPPEPFKSWGWFRFRSTFVFWKSSFRRHWYAKAQDLQALDTPNVKARVPAVAMAACELGRIEFEAFKKILNGWLLLDVTPYTISFTIWDMKRFTPWCPLIWKKTPRPLKLHWNP